MDGLPHKKEHGVIIEAELKEKDIQKKSRKLTQKIYLSIPSCNIKENRKIIFTDNIRLKNKQMNEKQKLKNISVPSLCMMTLP